MEEMTSNFITDIIDEDLAFGKVDRVHTRFPPEPNGYLHIGHLKAIYINSAVAARYNGLFNLRYDDTNPAKEDDEYVKAIYEDLCWLGATPTGGVFFGSDYFDKCYEFAVKLIKAGKAYVCSLTGEQIRQYRGTLTQPGTDSPYRNRSIEENLDLFERMKNGEFENGEHVLRAKIDMASPNLNMRDPVIYKIAHTTHHRQGDKWCIYPLYDFAHPIQDALEGITHSLCSLEFENHRPLYEWVVDNIGFEHPPKQREFAKLYLSNTVLSKRFLKSLIDEGLVDGWDDPRMPTICAMRRRGYTPTSLMAFAKSVGVSKADSLVDIRQLEACVRDELNQTAPRRIAIKDPIKVIIDNYPEDRDELFELPNHPQKPEYGTRKLHFTREIYIDRDDFSDNPPPKFFRLKPDGEVRLMGAYIIKCTGVEKDADGRVCLIHATADLQTGSSMPSDGRKIKGTIHWLSAKYAVRSTLMLYDKLFTIENARDIPEDEQGHKLYAEYINPASLTQAPDAIVEPSLTDAHEQERFQFVRTGYFCKDSKNPNTFNLIVGLRDSFGK